MGKKFQPLSPEERAAKIADAKSKLEAGVDRMASSEEFRAFLTSMAKFHRYSFNNTVLIYAQMPSATRVAGFNDWKNKHGRIVKKGEKSIKIFAPNAYSRKVENDNGEETTVSGIAGFRIASVFDISQTEGPDLPALPTCPELTDDSFGDQLQQTLDVAAGLGYNVSYGAADMSAKDYFKLGTANIVLKPGMSSLQTLKTLVHEMAHALGAVPVGKDAMVKDAEQAELVAEGSAFVVLSALGADTSEYSFRYLAHWGGDRTVMMAVGGAIRLIAAKILAAVDVNSRTIEVAA